MVEYTETHLNHIYAAIADPTRRTILTRLSRAELRVTELAEPFVMSLNAVSKHVRVLERAGLVRRQVKGRDHYLALEAEPLRAASAWIDTYRQFWEERLDALESFLTTATTDAGAKGMTSPSAGGPLRIVRRLPARPEIVFAAWTDAESLKTWMYPGSTHVPIAELDVRVGGQFRIVMRHAEHDMVHTGVYREIRPPERLVFTWSSNATRGETTVVTVELRPQGDDTELVLTHAGLNDKEAITNHKHGWQSITAKLEAYVYLRISCERS